MANDTHISGIGQNTEEQLLCSSRTCRKDDDIYQLECAKCQRLVHYKCTKLPAYQLQRFLTTKYRKFMCVNCVEVPTYLAELVPDDDNSVSYAKTMKELTNALNQSVKENEIHQVKILTMTKEQAELCEHAKISKIQGEDMINLQGEIKEYEKSMDTYEDNEIKLKSIIANQQRELTDQQSKFEEVGSPDYENFVKLEHLMNHKLEQVGIAIKESLLKEVKDNNKKLEIKYNQVINETKSYVEAVKNIEPLNPEAEDGAQQSSNVTPKSFKSILAEAENEKLVEQREREKRCNNIIIHGLIEKGNNTEEIENNDIGMVNDFFHQINIQTRPVKFSRLGKLIPDRIRPLKLEMESTIAKDTVMKNLSHLKGADEQVLGKLSVKDDLTKAERVQVKTYVDTAKKRNAEDPSKYWVVRGSPKNGLTLVSLTRKQRQ